ncbi:hypothetical protein HHK36_009213 [Tetracentron sinense]|uniref:Ubiquitin-like protease family profile domain-containing protein n=1 Tax=Tetracentron sinense TaxID=13715 RepID=A0A834ZCK5_TETSI|nr:hypothetical protein HHK36_009213 [Tetracentron sinense]
MKSNGDGDGDVDPLLPYTRIQVQRSNLYRGVLVLGHGQLLLLFFNLISLLIRLAKMLDRCSPSAFYNVVKEFSNEQKDDICRIGLGPLLQIHEKIHLRHHIIDFVVGHYSPESGAMMVDDTVVPLSLIKYVKGGYIYKATLEKMLKVDDNGEGFQRTFILYALCTLFVRHTKQYVSEKYLHTFLDMKSVKKIAWGEFAHTTLVEAICKVKNEKVSNVGGFVVFLQILPHDIATKSDERGNGDGHPLLVPSKSMPKVDFREKAEHPQHHDLAEILSNSLEKLSELQGIVDEHAAWRFEVEKDITKEVARYPDGFEIVICIDGAFVDRAAFSTLKPGGLLDDMVVDAYLRLLDDQFMQKCVRERKFASGTPVHANSGGFNIYQSNRVLIPVNRNENHWFLVEVDLLRRKVIIHHSMLPRRIIVGPEMRTLVRESLLQRCKEVEQTAREQATDNAILDQLCKGCPSTLGANRKSQDFFERVPARERHVKALFTEKVIHIIEKAVGCKIKMEETFIIVIGKDRLCLTKCVDVVVHMLFTK